MFLFIILNIKRDLINQKFKTLIKITEKNNLLIIEDQRKQTFF